MSFLPPNYRVPSAADKFINKLPVGDTHIRFLAAPVLGNQFWITAEDGKRRCIRRLPGEKISLSELDSDSTIEHFWAAPVWNYETEMVAVFEVKTKSILEALTRYAQNKAWGDPTEYDIVITRSGTGRLDTEYSVVANPKEALTPAIQKAWQEVQENGFLMHNLFVNGDPFLASVDADEVNIDDLIQETPFDESE